MLDGGGGGGYSGTNWNTYDVPAMWAMVKDQNTDAQWKQVTGWRRTYELTSTHLGRLKTYRDSLAAAWPPDKSSAAKAFVDRLDYLIQNVQQTYDIAVANHTTLSSATLALSTSRTELKKVYDEYVAKQQATTRPSTTPRPTPSPSPGTPPGNAAELERLNNKARSIMFGLSGELSQAQTQIKQPPTYQPRTGREPSGNRDVYGGGGSPPPTIPPIMAVPIAAPPAPAPTPHGHMQVVPMTTAPGAGPILGGAGTLAPPAAVSPIPSGMITPPPAPTPGMAGGFLPPMPPGPGMKPGLGVPSPLNPGTGALTKLGPGAPGGTAPRAMPPGGMIGGAPGAGLGQPGANTMPARRINPVGGVIGGSGTGPGMTSMSGTGQRPGAATGRMPMNGPGTTQPGGGATGGGRPGPHSAEDEKGLRWDPDNPWETDEGVAPVVLPAGETGRIDPGPAIGLDR